MRILQKVYNKSTKKNEISFQLTMYRILSLSLSVLALPTVGFKKSRLKEFNPHKNLFEKKLIKLKRNIVFNLDNAFDFSQEGCVKIKDIILAWDEEIDPGKKMLSAVYTDVLSIYANYDDNYDKIIVDNTDLHTVEGSYCFFDESNDVDIRIKKDMNVIDAGAWVGDFAAYAAIKGATCYAFEPDDRTFEYLQRTARLNGNKIIPVKLGLDKENKEIGFTIDKKAGGKINDSLTTDKIIKVVALDNFVEDNNIEKVDFIKSDIEGIERNLLMGATNVLKNHEPILSICTYHLEDDPEVLASIIKKANPNYKIIQRRMKLFAWVPQNKI